MGVIILSMNSLGSSSPMGMYLMSPGSGSARASSIDAMHASYSRSRRVTLYLNVGAAATNACLENRLNKRELRNNDIRLREQEYTKATWNCVINVVKAMYDLANEYGFAESMGELEVG